MDEATRLKAREFLLRSRIYRFMAMVFAVFGFIIFLYLYLKYVKGDIIAAFKNVKLVLIVLIPFLPAFVLSVMAAKAEKSFMQILGMDQDKSGDPAGKVDKPKNKAKG